MFYSHGGGFVVGSSGAPTQDGSNLARNYEVVVVNSNHRLGLLGYLYLGEIAGEEYLSSGNQGLLDVANALKWVKYRVLRRGPGQRDDFRRVWQWSKNFLPVRDAERTRPLQQGVDRKRTGDSHAPPALPGARLGWSRGISGLLGPGAFAPVVDGHILPNHPFDPQSPAISKNKPLIVGTNRDETTFFFRERKATDIFELTLPTLNERLQKELGSEADAILATYKESRPDASPSDIYVAITRAGMFWIGPLLSRKERQPREVHPFRASYNGSIEASQASDVGLNPTSQTVTFLAVLAESSRRQRATIGCQCPNP